MLGQLPSTRVWGGIALSRHLGIDAHEPIGELWLAYDESPVLTGAHAGLTVAEALPALGPAFIGAEPYARYGLELPLLVKFLDAAEWLSVQVHPDDAYAHEVERASGFHGKTEAWCILSGSGELVVGVNRAVERAEVRAAALDGSIDAMLAHVRVEPGDLVYLPAGTIHALGPGLVLYEVQQRSDLTYRLYDYGRPRDLHLDRALDVAMLTPSVAPRLTATDGAAMLAAPAFLLSRHRITETTTIQAPKESFLLLTQIDGEARWRGRALRWGETLLVAAGAAIELEGHATLLGSCVPSAEHLSCIDPRVRVDLWGVEPTGT